MHICKINVDFPIPGSPPNNVNEPSTKPPPSTLSNSSVPVFILIVVFFSTVFNATGSLRSFFLSFPEEETTAFYSKKVFQLLQAGHFPNHLLDS